jgi:pimeloyl-ACP methyl ester carboxylesterase
LLRDVSEEDVRDGAEHERPEAKIAFTQPCHFEAWPPVPTHVLVGADDRFFPREFQERVARERLGGVVDVIRGGPLVALSNPCGLADRRIACAAELPT